MAKEDHTEREMKTDRDKLIIASLSLIAVLAISCGRNILYSDNVRMNDETWSMFDPAKYSCIVNDTTGSYNLSFSVRTSTEYPYRNLYLFVVTTFPSGLSLTDTIQAVMSNEKGEWLGKGAGDIRELTIPYKSNVFFPEAGEYHFTIIHGMRDTILPGVYDLGIRIAERAQ